MAAEQKTITIHVNINKQYESTENLDPSNDILKLVHLDKHCISIEKFRRDISIAFARSRFKALLKDPEYEWKIFSYNQHKADIEIEEDDDLEDEIDEFFPTEDEIDDDNPLPMDQHLKLRVIFCKSTS